MTRAAPARRAVIYISVNNTWPVKGPAGTGSSSRPNQSPSATEMHLLLTRTSLLRLHPGLLRAFASRLHRRLARPQPKNEGATVPELCTQARAPRRACVCRCRRNCLLYLCAYFCRQHSCGANTHSSSTLCPRARFVVKSVQMQGRCAPAPAPPPPLAVTRPYVPVAQTPSRTDSLMLY